MRDPSEAELDGWMARLADGDREAFDPLFRALHPRALRLSRARLTDDQAADVAQAILMKVFARAGEFESGRPVLPWFYAVAANELRTQGRQQAAQRKRTAEEDLEHHASEEPDPERVILERELRVSLERAIAALDDGSAEAIACLLDGRPIPNLSAPAFRKRISRAYAKLRLFLEGLHER